MRLWVYWDVDADCPVVLLVDGLQHIEQLQSRLHLVGGPVQSKHIVFVDKDEARAQDDSSDEVDDMNDAAPDGEGNEKDHASRVDYSDADSEGAKDTAQNATLEDRLYR